MDVRKCQIENVLNNKFPSSEAQLYALDNALADEESQEYLSRNSDLLNEVQKRYRQHIQQTAQDFWQVSQYLFCHIADEDMGSTKEGEYTPDSLKKLPMQVNKINSLVTKEILSANNVNKRTIIMERWLAIMQRSIELGDFTTAYAIFSAFASACISRLKVDAGLSQNAKMAFDAMTLNDINVLSSDKRADKLRKNLIIPNHCYYKTMLLKYNHALDKLNDDELEQKFQLLNEVLEQNKTTTDYRKKFTTIIEKNRDANININSYAAKIQHLKEEAFLNIISEEDAQTLIKIKKYMSDEIKRKETNLTEFQQLWKSLLQELEREQKKHFEKRWKEIEIKFMAGRDAFKNTIATIVQELITRKRNLGKPIAFDALNDFQREIALGMTSEKFERLKELNYEKSIKCVQKPEEAPVCEIFKTNTFRNMITADELSSPIVSEDKKSTLTKQKGPLTKRNSVLFGASTNPFENLSNLTDQAPIHKLLENSKPQRNIHKSLSAAQKRGKR